MADNTVLSAGAGGDTIATDDIAGIKYQRVKINVGADGAASDVLPAANGLDSTGTGLQPAQLVAQLDDVATSAVTENQFANVRMSSRRALLVEGVASGTAQNVTVSTELPAGTQNIGDVDVVSLPSGKLANGTLTELDYDTGGGTVNMPLVGIALPGAGSPVAGGTSTNPFQVSLANTGANATAVKVDGSAVTQPISASALTTLATIVRNEDSASADADPGVIVLARRTASPANTSGTDGDYEALQISAGRLWASATIDAALPAGTNAIGKLAANSGVDIGDVDVTSCANTTGNVAHDGVDSGNPLKVGGKAATTLPAVVSAADRTDLLTDVYGRPFMRDGTQGPAGGITHTSHAPTSNTKATATKAAAGVGVRNVCTGLTVSLAATASAPTAVQLSVALIDGASGGATYLWGPHVISLPATAGAVSAFVIGKCWKPGTANTAMTLEFSAAGGANTIESVDFDTVTVAE